MFYLYSNPSCLQNKLHNFLAKSIEFVAASIGIIQTSESRVFKIWRYFITFVLISYNTTMTYTTSPSASGTPLDLLNAILARMSLSSYSILIIVFLVMIMIQQKNIRKCLIEGENVHQMCQKLVNAKKSANQSLFHTFLLKIGLDIVLTITLTVMEVISFVVKPTKFSFFNAIMSPLTSIVYCCIGTLYYVSLALAFTWLQTIHEDVKDGVNQEVSMFNHVVVRFVKMIQKTFQVTLLFLASEAFISFVSQTTKLYPVVVYQISKGNSFRIWYSCIWKIYVISSILVQLSFVTYVPQKLIDEKIDIQRSLFQQENSRFQVMNYEREHFQLKRCHISSS